MKIFRLQQYFIKYLRLFLNKIGLRRHRTIVFAAVADFHFQHLLSIIKEIEDTPNLKLIILDIPEWQCRPNIKNAKFISQEEFDNSYWKFFDLIIETDFGSSPWWFKSGIRIALFHGAGTKMDHLEGLADDEFDIVFSPGPLCKSASEKIIENTKGKNTKLLEIGLPAIDKLYNDAQSGQINPAKTGRKTILYAPSWHTDPSLVTMTEEFIQKLSSLKNYNVIMRPHPNLLNPQRCNGKDWKEIILRYENENFQLPLQGSIYDYLPLADAMIGDYSSVIYEYLVFDRPGFLFVSDEILDRVFHFNSIGPYFKAVGPLRAAYKSINNLNNLEAILDEAIINSNSRHKARNELLNNIFYNLGFATKTAADKIINLSRLN